MIEILSPNHVKIVENGEVILGIVCEDWIEVIRLSITCPETNPPLPNPLCWEYFPSFKINHLSNQR